MYLDCSTEIKVLRKVIDWEISEKKLVKRTRESYLEKFQAYQFRLQQAYYNMFRICSEN